MNRLLTYFVSNKILQNILASVLLISWFRLMMNGADGLSILEQLALILTLIFPAIFLSIVNNYFIIPYIKRREFPQAILLYVFIISIGSWFFTYFARYVHGFFCLLTDCLLSIDEILVSSLQILSMAIMVSLLALSLRITRDSLLESHEKKQRELKLLRSQLHPQFLLDILREFTKLSECKEPSVPQLMLSLSDLLRYTLYVSKEPQVLLEREYHAVEKYLALKQIYMPLQVKLEKRGDLAACKIAPMTILSVLDNSFSLVSRSQNVSQNLLASLEVENGNLKFECRFLDPYEGESHLSTAPKPIDLQSLKARMDLQYPEQYQLYTDAQRGVHLSLQVGS